MPTQEKRRAKRLFYYDVLDARDDPERCSEVSLKLLLQDTSSAPSIGMFRGTSGLEDLAQRRGLRRVRVRARLESGERAMVLVVCASFKLIRRLALLDHQEAFLFRGPESSGQLDLWYQDKMAERSGAPAAGPLRAALEKLLGANCTFVMAPRCFMDAVLAQSAGKPVEAWLTV